jgi:hypothetical protein
MYAPTNVCPKDIGIGIYGCGDFKRPRKIHLKTQCTVMRFLDLKEASTDMAADWIFEKFKLI